jgi:TPR repeat protein
VDLTRALDLYRKACDAGNAAGCNNLGAMYDRGEGTLRDDAQAFELYRKACAQGEANACSNQGYLHEKGRGTKQDYGAAVALYKKGCDDGNAIACKNLGVMYEYGRGFTGADSAMAATYYQKGCEGSARDACAYLSSSVESMRKDCDKGDCTNYGYIHASGIGVPKSQERAAEFYKKACDAKRPVGCSNLGILYANGQIGKGADYKKAAELYKRSCDLGGGSGCNNLGYLYGTGQGVLKSPVRAEEFYKKGCEKGTALACKNMRIVQDERAEEAKKVKAGAPGVGLPSIPTRASSDSSMIQTTAPH